MSNDFKFIDGKLIKIKKKQELEESINEILEEPEQEPEQEVKQEEVVIDERTLEEKIIEEALKRLGL